MNTYLKALRHINIKDVKQKHQQKIIEQKLQEEAEEKEKEYLKSLMEIKKYDWRKEIEVVNSKETATEHDIFVDNIVIDNYSYDWRDEIFSDKRKYFDVENLDEGMTTKDFEYLYGLSISNIQIDSSLGRIQNNSAQEIVQASSEVTDYQFGTSFPGSFINSIGDGQIISQSKVDALAFLDTTYGNVSGSDNKFTLTTGPEGLPPEGQSPPGSVVSTTNLQTALGVTLPAGVPNGNLGGTPIEGSAIKRFFTKAEPGKRINFNWQFASSEDALGAGSVDDYAFVAIKGTVTKFVSVLTKGLTYAGQFIYTVKPEDIVDGKVEIGIGVMDVFDPYVQTALTISNFGTFWAAGSLGSTTDAADLGMSVAAGMPQSQRKKEEEKEKTQQQTKELQKQSQSSPISTKQQSIIDKSLSYSSPVIDAEMERFARGLEYFDQTRKNNLAKGHYDSAIMQINNLINGKYPVSDETLTNLTLSIRRYELLSGQKFDGSKNTNPTPTTPPTPEKLANIEASLKQLEKDNEQIKADANRRNWELAAQIGMDALTAAALLSPIPGDEAIAIGARTASQTAKLARNFQRQNPGKYNPFLSDKANQLARQQGVGTNVKGQNPAFRNPIKNSYEPQGEVISEKSSPKRLKTVQQALYPGQPSPNGFPDTPPPEMVNGYHPDFGQKDNMYNTLDKTSADSTPLTGNGKIDKKIKAARKQPK